ncbi:porin family protein [Labilibacter marinus]|uniref:porin family protein n=1 Tax=Labilibacter marinus TaxID=1477105 RepID=UPI00094FF682|nr:porin family protein [Labilibacter marinus]
MKITILFIALLIITSLHTSAQDFKAGAVGGMTFSQVDGDTYAGFNKLGVVAGLYVEREFSELWSAQFEIVYKQKGSRHNPNESIGDYTKYQLDFGYVEVPIIAKIHVKKFSFEAGVSLGSLIHSYEGDQYGELPESIYPFEDFEFSSITGINYQFHPRMYMNLRWSYAFTRVRKAYGGDFDDQKPPHWGDGKYGQYNHVASFSIYYEFGDIFNR